MSINKAYEQYKKIDLQTAPQTRLVVMMYEGAIKFLNNAIVALDKKHGTEEAHKNIVKTQEIICELLVSLNYDAGEIADRLAAIYTYMNQKLAEGNISKNKSPLVEVMKYLQELKVAWDTAESSHTKQQNAPSNSTTEIKTPPKPTVNDGNIKKATDVVNNIKENADEKKNRAVDNRLKNYTNNKNADGSSQGKLNISG